MFLDCDTKEEARRDNYVYFLFYWNELILGIPFVF
jgi:hypothetical protein